MFDGKWGSELYAEGILSKSPPTPLWKFHSASYIPLNCVVLQNLLPPPPGNCTILPHFHVPMKVSSFNSGHLCISVFLCISTTTEVALLVADD